MLDFVRVATKRPTKDTLVVYPKFIVHNNGAASKDLMIKGKDFYAVWDEDKRMWSTNENDALRQIDRLVNEEFEALKNSPACEGTTVKRLCSWDSDSGIVDKWHKFCKQQLSDNFTPLDEKIMFSNDTIKKEDYASHCLSYPLKKGPIKNWKALMGVLYSPEELHKLEWAIGAIVTGDSKTIQKFIVLYGAMGTGKSTYLNIIQKMFDGYYNTFDAKSLGNGNAQFALESFKNNPLISIQHDGDLSRIEDNTRLNSIVSHEQIEVNEKNKSLYSARFHSFLFMGTNEPVKITSSKSGLLRRLIDVSPTGNKVNRKDYDALMTGIGYELGPIAYHCKELYLKDPHYYDSYVPVGMMSTTNDFYDYILENTDLFEEQDYTTLKQAWKLYKEYCDDANVGYPYRKIKFKEELKNYFEKFEERGYMSGVQARNLYSGFIIDKFKTVGVKVVKGWRLVLDQTISLLDDLLKDCPAQYANEAGTPNSRWSRVRRKLKDIDTNKLHYVKVPENHIVIDLDLKDPETGEKSFERNLMAAASKFPPTYAELSKSGAGIHLHYIYDGDVDMLKSIYEPDIEVKVFKGGSSLRRQLTKCNNTPVATISSGLPLKEVKPIVDFDGIKNEKSLRTMIKKNLNREYHPNTKPSMDFIKKILDDAYTSGLSYDVNDMRGAVLAFAAESTHQAQYCMGLIGEMHWASEDKKQEFMNAPKKEPRIIFLDIEVAPNLLLICWKPPGKDKQIVDMFNPTPAEIEKLMEYDWVGHNVRKYDNHIIYARWQGATTEQCAKLSKRIIVDKDKSAFFPSAYRLHYADTLDYPVKMQGLKKWEIELGIPHKEMDVDWNEPIPKEKWEKLAEYCHNDVIATEAVWDHTQADFKAREILATIANGDITDTTNQLSAKFMFGSNKNPQVVFNYRFMGDESTIDEAKTSEILKAFPHKLYFPEYTKFTAKGMPVFPGYTFENGKSEYRGEDPREGGLARSIPGFHGNVALLDIASQHPHSVIAENLFGYEFTQRFKMIVDTRIAIKHGDFEKARQMFNGKLAPFLEDESQAKDLAQALKIVINSVYGLTSAKFDNAFRDKRNKDNIVAKRGALFMINLWNEVEARGFKVAHIKTDSIKIPDATPEIIEFVNDYGKLYGYTFEHEATYERFMIVDKSNYVCKEIKDGYASWHVTGDKFAKPGYVFKTMFTHEGINLKDVSIMKSVSTCMYLDLNEDLPDVSEEEKKIKKLEDKFAKGELSDTTFKREFDSLDPIIKKGHNYTFVGKVGNFVPVIDGCGGGILVRNNERTGKMDAVNGSKGTRWLDAEDVVAYRLEDSINYGYFDAQIDKLKAEIAKVCINGDFEWFVSDDPYIGCEYDENGAPIYEDIVPFD